MTDGNFPSSAGRFDAADAPIWFPVGVPVERGDFVLLPEGFFEESAPTEGFTELNKVYVVSERPAVGPWPKVFDTLI